MSTVSTHRVHNTGGARAGADDEKSERASGARGADDEKSKRASELRALRARQRKGFYPRAPRARIDRSIEPRTTTSRPQPHHHDDASRITALFVCVCLFLTCAPAQRAPAQRRARYLGDSESTMRRRSSRMYDERLHSSHDVSCVAASAATTQVVQRQAACLSSSRS